MVVLLEMTRPDFEKYLEDEKYPVAIIPCGSIEQLARHVNHFLTTTQPWPGAKPSVAAGPTDLKAA